MINDHDNYEVSHANRTLVLYEIREGSERRRSLQSYIQREGSERAVTYPTRIQSSVATPASTHRHDRLRPLPFIFVIIFPGSQTSERQREVREAVGNGHLGGVACLSCGKHALQVYVLTRWSNFWELKQLTLRLRKLVP